ncbi:MAG: hypothetical protein JO270_15690, partial [Acidobacteriaceae bacterium]|nr:hypothetical protein [Acidobacteriaceae bacterium]
MQRRARLRERFAAQSAAVKPADALDITEIRRFPVREPVSGSSYSLLRVTTRSGVTGWGECGFDSAADIKVVQSAWVGRPVNAYATIAPSAPFRAALDIAFLDILGKATQAPVYRILGGPTRSKVRGYSSRYSQAFPVAVIDVPRPAWRNQGQAYQNRILELADAVPADRDFVLAGNGVLTPGDAASVAKTLEPK